MTYQMQIRISSQMSIWMFPSNHTHKNQMCNSKIIKNKKIAHKILSNIKNIQL
jgi:hypothetical protein